jgi:hypothetical protein
MIRTALFLVELLGQNYPQLEEAAPPKSKRRSLVQCATDEEPRVAVNFPLSEAMKAELQARTDAISNYKTREKQAVPPRIGRFYTPLNERGTVNPLSKLTVDFEEAVPAVLKCPIKGQPVTYSQKHHDGLIRGVRTMCWITSYQDWALRGTLNAVSSAMEANEKGTPGGRVAVDDLLAKSALLVQSLGQSWTDNNNAVCSLLTALTLAQRDALLAGAPTHIRETELSVLRKQPILSDEVFNGQVGRTDFEEKLARRLNNDSLSLLAKASFKKQSFSIPQQSPQKTSGQKGGGGGGQPASNKQQANQAASDFINSQQTAAGYGPNSNYASVRGRGRGKPAARRSRGKGRAGFRR